MLIYNVGVKTRRQRVFLLDLSWITQTVHHLCTSTDDSENTASIVLGVTNTF